MLFTLTNVDYFMDTKPLLHKSCMRSSLKGLSPRPRVSCLVYRARISAPTRMCGVRRGVCMHGILHLGRQGVSVITAPCAAGAQCDGRCSDWGKWRPPAAVQKWKGSFWRFDCVFVCFRIVFISVVFFWLDPCVLLSDWTWIERKRVKRFMFATLLQYVLFIETVFYFNFLWLAYWQESRKQITWSVVAISE